MSLDPDVAERLERIGMDSKGKPNLSAGITIVEHATRGMPLERLRTVPPPRKAEARSWIVFELVDGPADPPPPGETLDAWRDVLETLETPQREPSSRWEPGA